MDNYDDLGFSGGNTERPGLKRLMADIERGLVDIVVVYKIDRLTRSLADFSKMVEVFERQGVSFVSVTQQFNTTTSMGRLMLNVLSFAQFEREAKALHGVCGSMRCRVAADLLQSIVDGAPQSVQSNH